MKPMTGWIIQPAAIRRLPPAEARAQALGRVAATTRYPKTLLVTMTCLFGEADNDRQRQQAA